jgi:hypothetical protein
MKKSVKMPHILSKFRNIFLQQVMIRIFVSPKGCFMKQKKSKNSQFFILKIFWFLYKALKWALIIFLHLFSADLKRKRYQPTLTEQMLGEHIPFSDQYYIPDDHHPRHRR